MTQVETEHTLTPAQRDWVDALKSGDYPQARGRLRRTIGTHLDGSPKVGYCCLGVLADRAIKVGAVHGVWTPAGAIVGSSSVYQGKVLDEGELPPDVQDYAGVSRNPSVPSALIHEAVPSKGPVGAGLCTCSGCVNQPRIAATTLNDDLGYTLPEIGAIFELGFKRGAVQ